MYQHKQTMLKCQQENGRDIISQYSNETSISLYRSPETLGKCPVAKIESEEDLFSIRQKCP